MPAGLKRSASWNSNPRPELPPRAVALGPSLDGSRALGEEPNGVEREQRGAQGGSATSGLRGGGFRERAGRRGVGDEHDLHQQHGEFIRRWGVILHSDRDRDNLYQQHGAMGWWSVR